MSVAGKIEMVMQLYENGFLCKCSEKEFIRELNYDDNEEETKEVLKHEIGCAGKDKVKELIGI